MSDPANTPPGPDEAGHRFPEIDGYDIIDIVGVGGMGMVYEAIGRATGRRVALKVMRDTAMSSGSARQRFEREVEFIARLEHPDIVAVLDSGVHNGLHYCVMDFVEGSLLDEAMTPGECDPCAALNLIERVARAVDYAHQRGVLHRDLKPSNIMIDEQGRPHLLDFGLAKAIDQVSAMGGRQTISQPGQLIGTVAYMAPEQARGEIEQLSVRTDVYALGAIAYELLTGSLPVDVSGSLGDTLTRLESKDAARPGSIRPKLGSDIDAILLKSLEKNPASRYETAGAFADDVRRFLDGYPVSARRTGPAARLARLINRNRKVSAVIGIALIALVAVGSVGIVRVLDERSVSRMTNIELKKMYAFLDPNIVGREITVRDLFEAYAANLEANPITDPRVECEVQQRLGRGFFSVREYGESEKHLRRALELREQTGRGGRKALATTLHELAGTLVRGDKHEEAAPMYERALKIRLATLGPMHADVADTMDQLATTYVRLGRIDEAVPLHRKALEIRTRVFGPDHELIAASRMGLGNLLYSQGKFEEAASLYRDVVAQIKRKHGDKHEGVVTGLTSLSKCLIKLNRFDEANDTLDETLRIAGELWGENSDAYAWSLHLKAQVAWMQGDRERARELARAAVDGLTATLRASHAKTIRAQRLLDEINAPTNTQ